MTALICCILRKLDLAYRGQKYRQVLPLHTGVGVAVVCLYHFNDSADVVSEIQPNEVSLLKCILIIYTYKDTRCELQSLLQRPKPSTKACRSDG